MAPFAVKPPKMPVVQVRRKVEHSKLIINLKKHFKMAHFKHPKWEAWLMADYLSIRQPGKRIVVNLATDPQFIVDDSIDDVKCSHKEAVKALERIVDMPFNRFLAYIKARL